ncbi:GIDE domain-containing protein [Pseudomonas sp. 2FE]|uniref:GIDE domain-containing protein n=1 Tax=Pseudomonas sp. 2FE TaxID=2502190 RepID=UPI0010F99059|nr:GIDE domain-containing protein [Pseudomonas sp. 2FE]
MELQELALSLAFSVGACAGGAWWCLRRLAEARHLLDTPTSKIRSAAQGYVELYGVLQPLPETPILGPLTGKACLWWRFKIEEYSSNGKGRSWRQVESGSSEAWLRLADATGDCLIDPQGAQVSPATREVWKGNLRHPRGPTQSGIFGWLASDKDYRYTEERLHLGEPLYAIGDFRTSGGGRQGLDPSAAQSSVIREWKGDFAGLLQRFDSDRNGQLDEREWNRVRLAAQLEAEDRHRQMSVQPAQNHLARPREAQPFILSSHGEDDLARRFYWQAAAAAVLCLLGALATAWLLGITVV